MSLSARVLTVLLAFIRQKAHETGAFYRFRQGAFVFRASTRLTPGFDFALFAYETSQ
jgi:hypothetical protein